MKLAKPNSGELYDYIFKSIKIVVFFAALILPIDVKSDDSKDIYIRNIADLIEESKVKAIRILQSGFRTNIDRSKIGFLNGGIIIHDTVSPSSNIKSSGKSLNSITVTCRFDAQGRCCTDRPGLPLRIQCGS